MKKRTLFWIIGGTLLALIVAAIVLWLNANKRYEGVQPLHIYSDNTLAIVRISNYADFAENVRKTEYSSEIEQLIAPFNIFDKYNVLTALETADSLKINSSLLSKIEGRELFVSYHKVAGQTSQMLTFALNSYMERLQIEKFIGAATQVSDTVVDGQKIKRSPLGSFAAKDGCLIFSADEHLIASTLEQHDSLLYESSTFSTLERSMSTAPVSIFLNTDSLNICPGMAQWVELDLQFARRNLTASGFGVSEQTTPMTVVARRSSQPFSLGDVVPSSAATFVSYGASKRGLADASFVSYIGRSGSNDYRKAQQQLKSTFEVDIEAQLGELFAYDFGLFSFSSNLTDTTSNALVLKAQNGTVAQSALNSILSTLHSNDAIRQVGDITPVPTVNIPIYEAFTKDDNLFFLERMVPSTPRRFYVRYENSIYFSDNQQVLQKIICDILAHRTYNSDANFMNLCADFSTNNAFFYFCNSNIIKGIAEERAFDTVSASKFYGFALQVSGLSNLPYINAGLFYEPNRLELPPTIWQCRLDTINIAKPNFVINHNTKGEEILVQDKSNVLYLIDNKGITIWKRQLDGPIVGEVKQIDYYNNNKLQYLFCTPTHIQLIDRNGNNTACFPVRLPYTTKVGVSYIDYGNPQDMRLFVPTTDKSVYVFDRDGRFVDGWVMAPTEKELSNPVRHFVSGDKDYLVMADDYHVYITDRRGNIRIHVDELAVNPTSKIHMTTNNGRAAFVSTNIDGKWLSISIPDGKTTVSHIDSLDNEPHRFVRVAENRFAIVTEHSIIITDAAGRTQTTTNIEIGELAEVESTRAGIVVRDKKNNLIYIFDSNAKMLSGFPVPAYSPIAVNSDGHQLVTLTRDGMLSCFIK